MELNVGDYVRTKSYGITKVLNIYNNTTTNYGSITLDKIDSFGRLGVSVYIDSIIKSSPKIIDLIEVGDYANGYYVEDITNTGEELVLHIITGSNYFQSPFLYNEDIKSVLTHEQFEAMKYVVGDN